MVRVRNWSARTPEYFEDYGAHRRRAIAAGGGGMNVYRNSNPVNRRVGIIARGMLRSRWFRGARQRVGARVRHRMRLYLSSNFGQRVGSDWNRRMSRFYN